MPVWARACSRYRWARVLSPAICHFQDAMRRRYRFAAAVPGAGASPAPMLPALKNR